MKYTVIKLKAMKSGKRMAFIHDGKPRSYGRLVEECMTRAGICDHKLRDDWIDVADIEICSTRKAAEKSAKEYEEGR